MVTLEKLNHPKYIIEGTVIKWVEYHENGKIKQVHDDIPKKGYVLFIDPYSPQPNHQGKPILDIKNNDGKTIEFTTEEGEFKLQNKEFYKSIYKNLNKL